MIFPIEATVSGKSSTFIMPERHGHGVKFSINNLLIVAASQHFGRKGSGTLFLLKQLPDNEIICLQSYEWADALFDADWFDTIHAIHIYFLSKCLGGGCNGELICTASGDGSIQLWKHCDLLKRFFVVREWLFIRKCSDNKNLYSSTKCFN